MTDFSALLLPDRGQAAHVIQLVRAAQLEEWLGTQPERVRAATGAAGFKAKPGEFAILPGLKAEEWSAVLGVGEAPDPFDLAAAAARLPEGSYRLSEPLPAGAALGWLLAQHRFDRYRSEAEPAAPRALLTQDAAHIDEALALAGAVARVRDLVNMPANDLGPAELQAAVESVANACGASTRVTRGDALESDFPLIAAVGRAAGAARGPRLIELEWGDAAHPRVALIGKGVCFDSGGLDIKPASGMRLMKKDMGGAAHALALAELVMRTRLPVRLHLLIPAVENAIAGDAMRPGDIFRSRKGLSVEIANTDAEGRLILADALARAAEAAPALMLDFATLTGAARVALGPDLPALFANDDGLAEALLAAGTAAADPLWRLPLWPGYRDMLKSDVADLNNAPEGGFAGSITAALFLERFVPAGTPWAHLDTFAWMPTARPGRPKGGEALGLRAAWALLRARFAPAAAG
ncbi:leucyl aminopeptidase family protein [Sphingomonas morindae]|uniref:Leucyl aminopeptidase family protein n=1 Tax=Sphingomonas morindae TaxID=1541170 RepID=A0ABY4X5E7_9SPHN|nr:leucyl aminopeptidase family protein [Sphingomonas morindae]USI72101.1 leucyl aminopeptidase family protein [Sphingomonas morindae]